MSSQRRPKQENLKQKETMIMKTKLMKIITSCSLFACALASLAAATMLGTAGVARASSPQQTCSVRTLRGEYVFSAHGYNIVGGVAVPKAIVEGINFNGDGTLVSPFATVSINGTILHSSNSPGTYAVNTDCRGTLSFTGGPSFDIFVGAATRMPW
ncbi:MAG: hypothetical protein DME50_18915 [Verrucomicrobia bacterium]|nr:MAG: hypothetical protein DME50_18915 [Verrucomicrobiota bacterium]